MRHDYCVHRGRPWCVSAVGFCLLGVATMSAAENRPHATTVADHVRVGMEYTLTVDGAVVDSTEGKGIFHYVQGEQQLIPGLEHALTGLHVGETKDVTVLPEQGYGVSDPAAFVDIQKTQLPKDMTPAVGLVLRGKSPDGKQFQAKISEVKPDTVKLDLNHPLAGKTLHFKVKIIDLAPASVNASS